MPEPNSIAPKSLAEPGETPEDVATLYSWANLHGAKYRDFSASRAEAREESRLRVERAQAEERRKQEEEAERLAQEQAQIAAREAAAAAESARQAEAERLAEIARQAEAERQAVLTAQEAQRQAVWQRAVKPVPEGDGQESYPPSFVVSGTGAQPAMPPVPQPSVPRSAQPASHTESQRYVPPRRPAPGAGPYAAQYAQERHDPPASNQGYFNPPMPGRGAPSEFAEPYSEELFAANPWQPQEMREVSSRPAWLTAETSAPVAQNQPPSFYSQASAPMTTEPLPIAPNVNPAPRQFPRQMANSGSGQNPPQHPAQPGAQNPEDDTLAGSRDRIANRWFALKNVFDPKTAPVEQAPAQPPAQVPVLAVFSLAGGVGKTSLVASLGRALSTRGERVLLVDTAAYGLLPFFFGARDQRPGMLRTFSPPGASAEAPIQLVTLDPDGQPQEFHGASGGRINQDQNQGPGQEFASLPGAGSNPDWLASEVGRFARGANRVLIDLPTASGTTTRRVLRMSPVILVPVAPDMNSVVSVGAIEAFFRNNAMGGKPVMPFYVLNQFDYSLPLHLDVREILLEQIGDRLLPFALRRSPAVSEALAEGMTVMDYAPNAVVAEDYANLAGWVRSLSAPATQTYRGVRWSER